MQQLPDEVLGLAADNSDAMTFLSTAVRFLSRPKGPEHEETASLTSLEPIPPFSATRPDQPSSLTNSRYEAFKTEGLVESS